MSIKDKAKKFVDNLFGTSAAGGDREVSLAAWNREMKRREFAMARNREAAANRRRHEKRGAPGRSSKGRKPHRVS